MELQAIREKLQLLQAEPPAAETLALPWSSPNVASASSSTSTAAPQRDYQHTSEPSPQEIAIETLKQRSSQTLSNTQTNQPSANAHADNLIAQEIYRLEVQAHNINVRSQQQAEEIMTMKRAAQQAAVTLGRQGIHNHPQLAIISQLFKDQPSAVVPHIERDNSGQFSLTYKTIDFEQAQQDAIATAQALRQRAGNSSQPVPFAEPIETSEDNNSTANIRASLRTKSQKSSQPNSLKRLMGSIRRLLKGRRSHRNIHSANTISKSQQYQSDDEFDAAFEEYLPTEEFSWLDGAIWFSGAAIARIVIQLVIPQYPLVSMPLLVALVGIIIFVIYRVIVSKSSNFTPAYRLFIAMLGLLSVGLF